MSVRGYKVFNPDWTCRGFQYEVGKVFEEDVHLDICNRGFHFCKKVEDCFNYYEFDVNNKVAEVVALGNVVEDGDKCCTNKIQILRKIPWEEVLRLANTGKHNNGNHNSGNCNSGDYNSGNYNSGDCNSGNYNSGDCNSGHCNSGNCNSGHCNSGDWNKVNWSAGCFNTQHQKLKFFDKETDMTFNEWQRSPAKRLLDQVKPTRWIGSNEMTDDEKK